MRDDASFDFAAETAPWFRPLSMPTYIRTSIRLGLMAEAATMFANAATEAISRQLPWRKLPTLWLSRHVAERMSLVKKLTTLLFASFAGSLRADAIDDYIKNVSARCPANLNADDH